MTAEQVIHTAFILKLSRRTQKKPLNIEG